MKTLHASRNLQDQVLRGSLLAIAMVMAMLPPRAAAQAVDHSTMQMPVPAPSGNPMPADDAQSEADPAIPEVDHAAMGHDTGAVPGEPGAPVDHAAMEDPAIDHSTMDHSTMDHSTMEGPAVDHSNMDHSKMPGMGQAPREPITPIPVLTAADRAAAAPPQHGHSAHGNSLQRYVLMNRLETWDADPGTGLAWEGQAWFGTDLNRLWLRSEGERTGGTTESADLEVLYGRSIATWWDLVVGLRHDFKPGASQDFAAVGVIGLAPQKFEVEATAYVGERGQTAARLEAEYELLLTNRLILQPLVEASFHGKDDPLRGIGSGLGTIEAGFRLRYEVTRKFAPYLGIVRERAFGRTADYRREDGEDIDDTRLVAGVRFWF